MRFEIQLVESYIICSRKLKFILRIRYYSTVSTDDAVLVIGGDFGSGSITSIVAEYKDGSWSNIGNLGQPTGALRAMRSGSNILILGGMWVNRDGNSVVGLP